MVFVGDVCGGVVCVGFVFEFWMMKILDLFKCLLLFLTLMIIVVFSSMFFVGGGCFNLLGYAASIIVLFFDVLFFMVDVFG